MSPLKAFVTDEKSFLLPKKNLIISYGWSHNGGPKKLQVALGPQTDDPRSKEDDLKHTEALKVLTQIS